MYLNLIYIILITIAFQCLNLSTSSPLIENHDDEESTKDPTDYDCLLLIRRNVSQLMPEVLNFVTEEKIEPDYYGYLYINHNTKLIISCKPQKFLNTGIGELGDAKSLFVVTCFKSALVSNGKKYRFKDFICDGPVRWFSKNHIKQGRNR